MATFLILWAGQFVSGVGSALTGFALAVWVYQANGSVSELSWIILASTLPGILVSPAAGALVDRWNRRAVLLLSDTAAAAGTAAMALLILRGGVEVWQLCALIAVNSLARSFQEPAYLATVPLILPRRHLGRASGMTELTIGMSAALAPALGGALVLLLGIGGVLLIDLGTFAVALVTLLVIRIPPPRKTEEGQRSKGALLGEIRSGWQYLRGRPGLYRLMWIFTGSSFMVGVASLLFIPLMLSFTDSVKLGLTLSIASVGMILGGLLVATRGVPRRKVATAMGGMFLGGLLMTLVGLGPWIWLIGAAATAMLFVLPVARGSDQVLWQTKTAPDIQGRVFALRRLVARGSMPLAYLVTGPLADRVFEPAMARDGILAGSIGTWLGVGPGRGIALMFVLIGLGTATMALLGYMQPAIRNLERDVPDGLDEADAGFEARPAVAHGKIVVPPAVR